jgi:hypothetical protein
LTASRKSNAPPDRIGRLPVAQPLGELQHRDEG